MALFPLSITSLKFFLFYHIESEYSISISISSHSPLILCHNVLCDFLFLDSGSLSFGMAAGLNSNEGENKSVPNIKSYNIQNVSNVIYLLMNATVL